MIAASINGYNHTENIAIGIFSVNGGMGANVNPQSGGGKETCCVMIPKKWRAGLKAEIEWSYDTEQNDPNPPLPSQKIIIDIPEYRKPGRIQVHFYDNHRIKLVVSDCSITHPFYPMSEKDKFPWISYDKEEEIKAMKRDGRKNQC
ncbi:DUF3304 domain-containing protein [Janthinobacterium agaricidamnosum]|nr:DUF3304 domain-containing protein [Janthinobacterium agaricidamnosum]